MQKNEQRKQDQRYPQKHTVTNIIIWQDTLLTTSENSSNIYLRDYYNKVGCSSVEEDVTRKSVGHSNL